MQLVCFDKRRALLSPFNGTLAVFAGILSILFTFFVKSIHVTMPLGMWNVVCGTHCNVARRLT